MSNLSIGVAVAAVLTLLLTIGVYNSIIGKKNSVKRSWSDVLVYVQNKVKVIPNLERVVKEHKEFEKGTLEAIVKLRNTKLPSNIDTKSVEKFQGDFNRLMNGISVTVERYPDLKSVKLFNNLMKEIVEQQENISASIVVFNSNVESFNNTIKMFPSSAVNSIFNKEVEIRSFDTKAPTTELEFSPRL